MQTVKYFSFILLLLPALCFNRVFAQEEIIQSNPLIKVFQTKASTSSDAKQENNKKAAFQNIRLTQQRIAILTAAGKSPEEINKIILPNNTLAGSGSITGSVFSSDGITPELNYVSIYLYNEYGIITSTSYSSSYTNGTYKFVSIPSGKYYVCLKGSKGDDQFYKETTDWQKAELVQVKDGQTTAGIDFVMFKYTGYVSGFIKNSYGKRIKNCSIQAQDDKNSYSGYCQSDSNGFYLLGPLRSGYYKIMAQMADSQNYVSKYYSASGDYLSGDFINVKDNDTLKAYNFNLVPGGVIAGTILGEKGDTVKSNSCFLYDSNDEPFMNRDYSSSGNFIFTGLKPGTYKLECENYDMNDYCTRVWYDKKTSQDEAIPLIINKTDSIIGLKVIFPLGIQVSGKVNYSIPFSFENCRVEFYDKDKNMISMAGLNSDGTFTVKKLPEGEYKILFSSYMYGYSTGDEPLDQWYPDAKDFDSAELVLIKAHEGTKDISFSLKQGGSISGTVYGSDNQFFQTAGKIYAYDEMTNTESSCNIGFMGNFLITKLPTGKYKLLFSYTQSDGKYISQWYPGTQDFAAATFVNVTAPGKTQNINIHLKDHGSISGFIKNVDNVAISSKEHTLQVIVYDGITGGYQSYCANSFNGGYSKQLLWGSYKAAVLSLSYDYSGLAEDSLAVTYFPNGKSISDPSTKTLSLGAGKNQILPDIIVQKANGSISGKIELKDTVKGSIMIFELLAYDEDGYIAKVAVYASYNGYHVPDNYRICGLRPGKYYILAAFYYSNSNKAHYKWYNSPTQLEDLYVIPKMEIGKEAVPVIVGEGETAGINFTLDIPTGISPEAEARMPYSFSLNQNYPNPFNPSTTIEYELPERSVVSLKVFDILGREVAELIKGEQIGGKHKAEFNASGLASGIYIYQLNAGNRSESRKFILMK